MNIKKYIPKVPKVFLLLLAALVWSYAGYKILDKGIPKLIENWRIPALNIVISIAVFFIFFKFIFLRMYKKHTKRILSYEEKANILLFFDIRGYIIMTFMITLGITISKLSFINPEYLGTFYLGLGSALLTAGIRFFISFFTKILKR